MANEAHCKTVPSWLLMLPVLDILAATKICPFLGRRATNNWQWACRIKNLAWEPQPCATRKQENYRNLLLYGRNLIHEEGQSRNRRRCIVQTILSFLSKAKSKGRLCVSELKQSAALGIDCLLLDDAIYSQLGTVWISDHHLTLRERLILKAKYNKRYIFNLSKEIIFVQKPEW